MTDNKTSISDQLKAVTERARQLYTKGSLRTVIVRRENGKKLFEVNMALAAVVGIFTFLVAAWMYIPVALAWYFLKLRAEIIREADDGTIIDSE